jgi:hypothetical protein
MPTTSERTEKHVFEDKINQSVLSTTNFFSLTKHIVPLDYPPRFVLYFFWNLNI